MARFYIQNIKAVEGVPVEAEYDYGGNTRVLAAGQLIEVSFDEGQTALGRLRDDLVYYESPDDGSYGTPQPYVAGSGQAPPPEHPFPGNQSSSDPVSVAETATAVPEELSGPGIPAEKPTE